MSKFVGLFILLTAFQAWALAPIEGILMGEAHPDYQLDPLSYVFRDLNDVSNDQENRKLKLYHHLYTQGLNLSEQCGILGAPSYATSWQEAQAKRSIIANLQYLGLDLTVKAIGAYAKELTLSEEEFLKLKKNLIGSYCSKNVTVYSLRNLETSLQKAYDKPDAQVIPSVTSSSFATQAMKNASVPKDARSKEMNFLIKNFRAFCSWGEDPNDLRLLVPYLKNPFIMSHVFQNMSGVKRVYDEKTKGIRTERSEETPKVVCRELICRSADQPMFNKHFPLSVGSTGVHTDLARMYCHQFKPMEYKLTDAAPQIKKWIKESEIEDPILETNYFISLMSGVPDILFGVETYDQAPKILKSSVDERWNIWSKQVLDVFGRDMLYEESFKVKAIPRREIATLAFEGFAFDFMVTLGELDRLIGTDDKLHVNFDIKLPKNYLIQMRDRYVQLTRGLDPDAIKAFKAENARYLELHLRGKEKLFTQKMWNDDFARLISEELLGQVLAYQGPLFSSYEDKMLTIPVRFSYGMFALSYLRYRADTQAGRLKLNL
jgi:hypothetical protein